MQYFSKSKNTSNLTIKSEDFVILIFILPFKNLYFFNKR